MKRTILILACLAGMLEAKVNVVTSYAYIADLVQKVGGEAVKVTFLAKPTRDPHYIIPKPSFIAKVRNADLLVINGGGLEVGWIPPLVSQSGNPAIQPGAAGYVDLSYTLELIDKPTVLSRTEGDVHPEGNPHFSLDMYQVPKMAAAVSEGLCRIDGDHCLSYRENEKRFALRWGERVKVWEAQLASLKGTEVIQSHKLFDYLLRNAGMTTVEALEPIPGVPPTAKHIAGVIRTIKTKKIPLLINSVYFPVNPVELVKAKTDIRVVTLPHDVGALEGTDDLAVMFGTIIKALVP